MHAYRFFYLPPAVVAVAAVVAVVVAVVVVVVVFVVAIVAAATPTQQHIPNISELCNLRSSPNHQAYLSMAYLAQIIYINQCSGKAVVFNNSNQMETNHYLLLFVVVNEHLFHFDFPVLPEPGQSPQRATN